MFIIQELPTHIFEHGASGQEKVPFLSFVDSAFLHFRPGVRRDKAWTMPSVLEQGLCAIEYEEI